MAQTTFTVGVLYGMANDIAAAFDAEATWSLGDFYQYRIHRKILGRLDEIYGNWGAVELGGTFLDFLTLVPRIAARLGWNPSVVTIASVLIQFYGTGIMYKAAVANEAEQEGMVLL